MATKYECDRCHRQFTSPAELTAVLIPEPGYSPVESTQIELCDRDIRDLRSFLKQRITRDRYGNEEMGEPT
jgi:hypothetical protein